MAQLINAAVSEAQLTTYMRLDAPELISNLYAQTHTKEQALQQMAAGKSGLPPTYDPTYPYVVKDMQSKIAAGQTVWVPTSYQSDYGIKSAAELQQYINNPSSFAGRYN